LAGETKVLRENLPQRHFCPSQNPTWPDPDLNPGRRGGKPATNRLSYGAAEWIRWSNPMATKVISRNSLWCLRSLVKETVFMAVTKSIEEAKISRALHQLSRWSLARSERNSNTVLITVVLRK
jgi:hypothetical protein